LIAVFFLSIDCSPLSVFWAIRFKCSSPLISTAYLIKPVIHPLISPAISITCSIKPALHLFLSIERLFVLIVPLSISTTCLCEPIVCRLFFCMRYYSIHYLCWLQTPIFFGNSFQVFFAIDFNNLPLLFYFVSVNFNHLYDSFVYYLSI
jgi:hypothetical protein